MTDMQWAGMGLFLCCGLLALVFAANNHLPGNAVIPGRLTKPFAYWGNLVFFSSFALLGLYGATVGFE